MGFRINKNSLLFGATDSQIENKQYTSQNLLDDNEVLEADGQLYYLYDNGNISKFQQENQATLTDSVTESVTLIKEFNFTRAFSKISSLDNASWSISLYGKGTASYNFAIQIGSIEYKSISLHLTNKLKVNTSILDIPYSEVDETIKLKLYANKGTYNFFFGGNTPSRIQTFITSERKPEIFNITDTLVIQKESINLLMNNIVSSTYIQPNNGNYVYQGSKKYVSVEIQLVYNWDNNEIPDRFIFTCNHKRGSKDSRIFSTLVGVTDYSSSENNLFHRRVCFELDYDDVFYFTIMNNNDTNNLKILQHSSITINYLS